MLKHLQNVCQFYNQYNSFLVYKSSSKYPFNKSGDKTLPWRTPFNAVNVWDLVPSEDVHIFSLV